MKTSLALYFVLIFCAATQFDKVAFAAPKIPINEIKAIACVVVDKARNEEHEIDRMPFTGIGGLWAIDDKCEDDASAYAKRRELSDWRRLCCPITADDKIHCEAPLGSHGKW